MLAEMPRLREPARRPKRRQRPTGLAGFAKQRIIARWHHDPEAMRWPD